MNQLVDYQKFLEITGFQCVKIDSAKAFVNSICREMPKRVEIQLFDARLVATWEHLYFAALNACAAFQTGRCVSKSISVEIALYASSRRQIKKALNFIGVKPDTHNVAVMLLGDDPASVKKALAIVKKRFVSEPQESVLELHEEKKKIIRSAFEISDAELEVLSGVNLERALVDLVLERVALLSTRL